MASVSQRGSSRRRTINEINMVPFIDVMLVLLIIFMVTAPLITTGVIDLPSVGKSSKTLDHVIELQIASNGTIRLKVDKSAERTLLMDDVQAQVKSAQADNANTPVVISADKSVKYELVVKLMDILNRSGVKRVGLSVKNSGA